MAPTLLSLKILEVVACCDSTLALEPDPAEAVIMRCQGLSDLRRPAEL
jgi:hypothetical protein